MLISGRSNLKLYHGSLSVVEKPEPGHAKGQNDFGSGFYLTTDKAQAEGFVRLLLRRSNRNVGYINVYSLANFKGLRVKEFTGADVHWLKFILRCRAVRGFSGGGLDAAIGKIADDNTREVFQLYLAHAYDNQAKREGISPEEICIRELMTDKLKNQVCMYTKRAMDRLNLVEKLVVQRRR